MTLVEKVILQKLAIALENASSIDEYTAFEEAIHIVEDVIAQMEE